MRTKLLRKLRKNVCILYYPETMKYHERWDISRDNKMSWKTYFTFKEALLVYHSYMHTMISCYQDTINIKQII
jgi:hypothetical protein